MARAGGRHQDAPEARIGAVGIAILAAEPDERIFAGQDRAVGVGDAHDFLPREPGCANGI